MGREGSPQDKKARSLAHDRRNSYGENDKSSRTAIRARKAWVHRIARQASRQALHDGLTGFGEPDVEVVDPQRRSRWRKCPDTSLGMVLYWRRIRRFHRALAARLAEDPEYLVRLEAAAVRGGLSELAARMIMRQLRTRSHGYRRDAQRIPDDALRVLQGLVRRIA